MYAFADKTDQKKKTDSTRHHSTARRSISVPGYILDDLPEQSGLGNTRGIVQRYPVRVEDGRIVSTAHRPSVPDTKEFRTQLTGRSHDSKYRSPHEMDLQEMYPDQEDAVKAIGHRGGYRSQEGCAFCHKVSISDVEDVLVEYANTGTISPEFTEYLTKIDFDTQKLEEIQRCAALEDKAAKVNQFIREINRLPRNYYIGDAGTNSMIGSHLDPHVDFETGRMSPVSWFAYEHQDQMGITPAKSDGYGGFYTSSLPH